jgi:hypothetical protein
MARAGCCPLLAASRSCSARAGRSVSASFGADACGHDQKLGRAMTEGPGLDSLLDELWSERAIRHLAYDYAFAVDTRDVDLALSLWAEPDAVAELPDIDIHFIRAASARWASFGPSILFVGNHRIRFVDSDSATGTVYCLVQMEYDGRFVAQTVLYSDQYIRQDGRWLFLRRRHMMWYGDSPERNPFDQAPANWPVSPVGRGILPEEFASYREYTRTHSGSAG